MQTRLLIKLTIDSNQTYHNKQKAHELRCPMFQIDNGEFVPCRRLVVQFFFFKFFCFHLINVYFMNKKIIKIQIEKCSDYIKLLNFYNNSICGEL